MRAIIHSIHSQVPATIKKLGHPVDTIVSLDSHLDVSLGGDEKLYPKKLRSIAARTGAHTAFRRIPEGPRIPKRRTQTNRFQPRFIIAIPHLMLARHAADVESRLPASLRLGDQRESIASVAEFLERTLGIELYESPPRPLSGLALGLKAGPWVLDLDVDYIQEMQKECYTQIRGAGPGVLQSMSSVVRFIRESRPETITLSEARISAIRDPGSNFSNLIARLAAMGYEMEEDGVYSDDAEVLRGIAVCKEFYQTVSQKLLAQHMPGMIRGDFKRFKRDERMAAGKFFQSRGYAV
ncbi:MAG: hypothetical protein OK438_07755 [Thaumarchaeota archaeon]|nr:hypothetical protein [Nitrososphaerota archaeon]